MKRSYVRRKYFLYGLLLKDMMLYQKKQKRSKIDIFEPTVAAIFTHRRTCINKPCEQSGEFLISEAGNIAVSEAQIFWMCFCLFSW